MNITEKIIDLQKRALGKSEDKYDIHRPSYFVEIEDNLICPMAAKHRKQYGEGSGGEMCAGADGKPPKMASVRSSSAMTFNLLGNHETVIIENGHGLPTGKYRIEYEKKFWTLACPGKPANLDAYLEGRDTAIFCEMKMLEWLRTGYEPINVKYRQRENYFFDEAYEFFAGRLLPLIEERKFIRYDAWQMFKHMLAVYNAFSVCAPVLNEEVYRRKIAPSCLAGKFKEVVLANVVYLPENINEAAEEKEEGMEFIELLKSCGVLEFFRENCGVNFSVKFFSAWEFAGVQGKEKDRYLERYWEI